MMTTNINFKKHVFCFDFDGVLDKKQYQLLATYLLSLNKQVYICTKRFPDEAIEGGSDEVYNITNQLGIDINNVIFTQQQDKSPFLIHYEIDVFWDDTLANLQEININAPYIDTILVK